jgi:hypothetical protein
MGKHKCDHGPSQPRHKMRPYLKYNKCKRVADLAEVVEYLSSKHLALSSTTSTVKKKKKKKKKIQNDVAYSETKACFNSEKNHKINQKYSMFLNSR